jgi:hypothetical protein
MTRNIDPVAEEEQLVAEWFPAYPAVKARLGGRLQVDRTMFSFADVFSVAFVRLFLADCPNYQQPDGSYGASRSNWTYHTALAMSQAAKLMTWTCKFETAGKRDAILETTDEQPVVVLVAEWEWDTQDVFGKGKELDKLKATCRDHPAASAFLLTYCTGPNYPNFLERVAGEWSPTVPRRRKANQLYLHTIVYSEQGRVRQFERLRTALIEPGRIELWCDEKFE